MVAVTTMVNDVEAVAYKGWHPNPRYIGTKNNPPPSPNPLKTPAIIL